MPPRAVLLHSVSPLTLMVFPPVIWAITADGAAAAITVLGVALSWAIIKLAPAIANAIREIGPAVIEFKSGMAKALAATDREVQLNKAEIAQLRRENADLRHQNVAILARQHGIEDNVTGLGEVVLIQTGDMLDPVKDKPT